MGTETSEVPSSWHNFSFYVEHTPGYSALFQLGRALMEVGSKS